MGREALRQEGGTAGREGGKEGRTDGRTDRLRDGRRVEGIGGGRKGGREFGAGLAETVDARRAARPLLNCHFWNSSVV